MTDPLKKSTVPLASVASGKVELTIPPSQTEKVRLIVNGVAFDLPPELDAAIRRACEQQAEALPEEMTTIQAAEFLDVSRPFVVKLIRRGELPCRMVGTHRRIPTEALRQYREKMFQQAKVACDEMARTSQELGLYDSEESSPKPR